MDDTKLIELAGNAAGEVYTADENPLTSDALALRLAVKLGVGIQHSATIDTQEQCIETFDSLSRFDGWFEEVIGDDPYAATRRAVVKAAAEIARRAASRTPAGASEAGHAAQPNQQKDPS
jgi:hypothetical protein